MCGLRCQGGSSEPIEPPLDPPLGVGGGGLKIITYTNDHPTKDAVYNLSTLYICTSPSTYLPAILCTYTAQVQEARVVRYTVGSLFTQVHTHSVYG